MDGLTALGTIMQQAPSRVIMLSSVTSRGTRQTVRALYLGALEFIAKPTGRQELPQLGKELVVKIHAVMQARLPTRKYRTKVEKKSKVAVRAEQAKRLVVIGASTGGPGALEELLAQLTGSLSSAVLVVQHMPKGFTASLAQRLDGVCALPVEEAGTTVPLITGRIYLARGGNHLLVHNLREAHSIDGPSRHGVKPAVDVTLESGAIHFGRDTTAVILTGMGRDGTEGCRRIHALGGRVLAQNQASSVVYGMPRAVIQAGLAPHGMTLSEIAKTLNGLDKEAREGGNNDSFIN